MSSNIRNRPTPLAIIGIAGMFPKAENLSVYWSNIKRGTDAITEIPETHWPVSDYFDADPEAPDRTYASRGGFLERIDFCPMDFGISPADLEAIDTSQLLGLVVARQAMEDAGYGTDREFDRNRVSVLLGVTGTQELVIPLGARLGHPIWRRALQEAGLADDVVEQVVQRIADSYVPWQENSFPGLLGNVVAGRIANRLDLGGTNCVIDAACASSLGALHLAALELEAERSDMVLAGGIDTFNDIFMYMCFSKTPALSPTGDAKPFDKNADGTILGEGVGMLVLKRLADAQRDDDRIYAVIRGLGTSSDGKGGAVYAPKSAGQVRAIEEAYRVADVAPDSIELLEAHGTGTKVGDANEISALAQVYGSAGRPGTWCALGSVKSQIGHTKAAAGVASIIKVAMALKHRVLPPTIKVRQPNPILAPGTTAFYVNTELRPWLALKEHPRRAAVSSFGFGGSNYHCVLEEAPLCREEIDWDGNIQILSFSADSIAELQADSGELIDQYSVSGQQSAVSSQRSASSPSAAQHWQELRRKCGQARKSFDVSKEYRLHLVLERDKSDVRKIAAGVLAMLQKYPEKRTWSTPEGAHFGRGKQEGKLGILFPGQGSQYVGMLRDLACQFPRIQKVLAGADAALASETPPLSEYIYPFPVFSDEARDENERRLRDTEIAQPAIGAVSLGALLVLEDFAVRPQVVAGHSYGELTALCASKRFEPAVLYLISKLRGRLMAEGNGDRGAMLAVGAPADLVDRAIREEGFDLVIANHNAPSQVVLSGSASEIDRAAKVFALRDIRRRRLPVSAAFHSPLVARAREQFRPVLSEFEFSPGTIPVYANSTAQEYPDDPEETRDLLASQLAEPVDFVSQIKNMYDSGVRIFLEVGPGNTLTGLVDSILDDREHKTLALDASCGKRSGIFDLAHVLAQLSALGHDVRLKEWDPAALTIKPVGNSKGRLTVPICGANFSRQREAVSSQQSAVSEQKATFSRDPSGERVDRPTSSKPETIPNDQLTETFRLAQESLIAVQRMQEQTSQLHRQYLEGQETAQRTIQMLIEQQQRLWSGDLGVSPSPLPPISASPPQSEVLSPTPAPLVPTPTPPTSPAEQIIPSPPRGEGQGEGSGEGSETAFEQLSAVLLEVVAEKTGYPSEMLELDMGLEEDLGIDSIKRVEILSALQEKIPEAPTIGSEHLGTLRTLRQVIDFLIPSPPRGEGQGDEPTATNLLEPEPHDDESDSRAAIERSVLTVVPLEEEADRPTIPLAENSAIWITDDGSQLAHCIVERLRWLGHQPRLLDKDSRAPSPPDGLGGLLILSPRQGADDAFLKGAFELLKKVGPALRRLGGETGAFFVTVSRLDGAFGLAGDELVDPKSGGLAGLSKTVRHEWPGVRCKALDLCEDIEDPAEAALAITDEIFRDGPVEVGLSAAGRRTLELTNSEMSEVESETNAPLADGDVVVISGGARGVTAEVAVSFAKAFRPTLVLLGRSPQPGPEPDWLAALASEAEIKKALIARLGNRTTPREIGEECLSLLAAREIRRNLDRIASAANSSIGEKVFYRSVDVRDAQAVRAVIDEIRSTWGPVRGLIHGAGVIEDRFIDKKTIEQFERVYSTKILGLENLLAAFGDDPLKVLVLFSSITGRHGRAGQVDYAVANEVLGKLAQQESRRRHSCRVLSIGWGPWEGGMVTPALRTVFENEGVPLIPLRAGAEYLVGEIFRNPGPPVEVVVMGAADDSVPKTESISDPLPTAYCLLPTVPSDMEVAFERELDFARYPFLKSHVIDGRAVLPMAMIVEWLSHGAIHGNPGLVLHGFDELRIHRGIRLDEDSRLPIRVLAGKGRRQGDLYHVPVKLLGSEDGQDVLHAATEIVLATSLPRSDRSASDFQADPYPHGFEEIYGELLFHGHDLQGIEEVEGCSKQGIVACVRCAPSPGDWISEPLRNGWLADPLVLDCAFQLMILWSLEQRHAGSLPCFAGRYRQYCRSFPQGGVRIVAQVTRETTHRAYADIEFIDHNKKLLARIQDYECVIDASLEEAFRRNTVRTRSKMSS